MASRKKKARRRAHARAQHDLTIQHALRAARSDVKRAISAALDRLDVDPARGSCKGAPMTPDPAFPEDMRERVERWRHAARNYATKANFEYLARWALERDAEASKLEDWRALRPEVHAQAIASELGPLFAPTYKAEDDIRNSPRDEPPPLLLCDTLECRNQVPFDRVESGPHVCRTCLPEPREPGTLDTSAVLRRELGGRG